MALQHTHTGIFQCKLPWKLLFLLYCASLGCIKSEGSPWGRPNKRSTFLLSNLYGGAADSNAPSNASRIVNKDKDSIRVTSTSSDRHVEKIIKTNAVNSTRIPSDTNTTSISTTTNITRTPVKPGSAADNGSTTSHTSVNKVEVETDISQPLSAHAGQRSVSTQSAPTAVETVNSEPNVSLWRQELPRVLQNKGNHTLQRLEWNSKVTLYILGTAHVSNDSCLDVELLLQSVNPDVIMVELCDARLALLESPLELNAAVNSNSSHTSIVEINTTSFTIDINGSNTVTNDKPLSFWQKVKQTQQLQGGSRWQACATVLLTQAQEDYATEMDVELGGEFRVARDYWKNVSKATALDQSSGQLVDPRKTKSCSLVLGDRPLSITLWRSWESLGWWSKVKVIVGLLWSTLRKPNKEELQKWLNEVMAAESDVLTESLLSLKRHFPTLYDTIIAERDAWMAAKLVQICQTLSNIRRPSIVVAIVGAGHVPGMIKWLTAPPEKTTPRALLLKLAQTRKFANDPVVQKEYIPAWVEQVTQVEDAPTPPQLEAPIPSVQ